MSERLESMKQFAEQFPDNPFPRYALALEFKNAGRSDEAVQTFQALIERLPAYVPAYLQFGKLLEDLGRTDEAKAVLTTGVERAREARDSHALGEIQGLLESLSG